MTPEQYEHNLTIPGWLAPGDIRALSSLSSTITDGHIVELGSLHGRSAYCLSVSSPTSSIYCLDFWGGWECIAEPGPPRPNTIDVFKSYTKDCKNVVPVHLVHGQEYDPVWPDQVDMVFLDAAHTNPDDWNCIEYWLPKIRPGGILCGHDYYTEKNCATRPLPYPDIVENTLRLEKILGKKMILQPNSCVWSFVV